MVVTPLPTAEDVLAHVGDISPDRYKLVRDAYNFALTCHDGQMRESGDPYIVHPVDAAITVADMNMDAPSIAAALLHDVVEDCGVSYDQVAKLFGDEVARIVDGVTKLGKLSLVRPEAASWDEDVQADNLRKMFLAMADDLRVVVVKLADRLHNMRTLYALPATKQVRIARETGEIYAPLANRLGLGQIAHELEDLSFRYLEPEKYASIVALLDASKERIARHI